MKIAKLSDLLGIINKIAPPGLAETWDNSGLQLGDLSASISRIMIALDATPVVVASAIASSCQLLVTHHPLIFKPLKSISTASSQGRLIHDSITAGLSIISIHTNYDVAEGGLNDLLAERLGVEACVPLRTTSSLELTKLVAFIPEEHLENVRSSLLGYAENLGDYRDCSFAAHGEGTFTPQEGAKPFIGKAGEMERVPEHRLELLVYRSNLARAVKALLAAHPYEEPAFDIYPLLNEGKKLGLGRIGEIMNHSSLADYAAFAGERLQATGVRYAGDPDARIKKIALCSGSGASLLQDAVRAGADCLVTGDVKYHNARDAEDIGIALLDIGHYPSEHIMVADVGKRLAKMLKTAGFMDCEVLSCPVENDPFRYCSTV